MKSHPEGAELFHSEGQTDMTKLIVAFRNFHNLIGGRMRNNTLENFYFRYKMRTVDCHQGTLLSRLSIYNLKMA